MPIHPLKAWPFGEWWMPAASTGASTSSGAAYCWLLRLMGSIIGPPYTSTKVRRVYIVEKSDFMRTRTSPPVDVRTHASEGP